MKRVLIVTGWCFAIRPRGSGRRRPPPTTSRSAICEAFRAPTRSGAAYYSVTFRLPSTPPASAAISAISAYSMAPAEPVPYSLDSPRVPARRRAHVAAGALVPDAAARLAGNGAPPGVTIAADGSLRATAAPAGPRATRSGPDRRRRADAGRRSGRARCSSMCATTTTRGASTSNRATICATGNPPAMRNCSRSTTTAAR